MNVVAPQTGFMNVPHHRLIVSFRRDRLAARLSSFLSAIRFARVVGARTHFYWPAPDRKVHHLDGPDYRLSQIIDLHRFALRYPDVTLIDGEPPRSLPYPDLTVDARYETMRLDGFDPEAVFDGQTIVKGVGRFYRWRHEDKDEVIAEVRAMYRELPLNEKLIDILADIRDRIGSADFAVCHVRRGDVIETLRDNISTYSSHEKSPHVVERYLHHFASRIAPMRQFARTIKALDASSPIIVFSDSVSARRLLARKFGSDRILDVSQHGKRLLPIQKAMLDFELMSQAACVFGSGSSFGYLATVLGNGSFTDLNRGSKDAELIRCFKDEVLSRDTPTSVAETLVGRLGEILEDRRKQPAAA